MENSALIGMRPNESGSLVIQSDAQEMEQEPV